MNINQQPQQNPIVDFIEDEAFYNYRKKLDGLDKPIISIYIFATLSLLMFVFFMIMNNQTLDWLTVAINLAVIAVYYCLAVYSSQQPFSAFVATIAFVVLVMILNIIFAATPNVRGMIIQIILIVVISLKLEDAKDVQSYQKGMVKGKVKNEK